MKEILAKQKEEEERLAKEEEEKRKQEEERVNWIFIKFYFILFFNSWKVDLK